MKFTKKCELIKDKLYKQFKAGKTLVLTQRQYDYIANEYLEKQWWRREYPKEKLPLTFKGQYVSIANQEFKG